MVVFRLGEKIVMDVQLEDMEKKKFGELNLNCLNQTTKLTKYCAVVCTLVVCCCFCCCCAIKAEGRAGTCVCGAGVNIGRMRSGRMKG